MKKLVFLLVTGLMIFTLPAEAQIFKKITKKAEQAVERSILKKTDQNVTKETDKAIDGVLGEKGASEDAPGDINPPDPKKSPSNANASGTAKTWSKYNFVPGDEIIFEDDLSLEENGEFPSRWDLVKGNAENSSIDGAKIITISNRSIVAPLINKDDYLPEVFTVEFDAYFNDTYSYWQYYNIRFFSGDMSQKKIDEQVVAFPLKINRNGASIKTRVNKDNKEFKNQGKLDRDGTSGWKHIAISYNQRALKVFIDEDRVLNLPNIELDPTAISIEAEDSQKGHIMAIKNMKIAQGGKKLYDRIVADGKFITRGILFDVNKAILKPESTGVINEIAALMNEHVDLEFSIEGHTDSDGEEANNLNLSEQRAMAVKEALANQGIDSSRMQHKGFGESTPVSNNTSPEGKANNRRVEFVKI